MLTGGREPVSFGSRMMPIICKGERGYRYTIREIRQMINGAADGDLQQQQKGSRVIFGEMRWFWGDATANLGFHLRPVIRGNRMKSV